MGRTLINDIARTDRAAVESFIERLAALGPEEWSLLAAAAAGEDPARARVGAMVDLLVARHGLSVDVWNVMDDVETAFHCGAESSRLALTRRQLGSMRVAREAARTAAIAVFVRPLLTPDEFDAMYGPFAMVEDRAAECRARGRSGIVRRVVVAHTRRRAGPFQPSVMLER